MAAYIYRGRAYAEEKAYDRAITDFSKVIEIDPKYAIAYADRGRAYAQKKEFDRAISDFTNPPHK